MNTEQYDEIVIKIQMLFEEMYSVQERMSGNLVDKTWPIYFTLGGVISHGSSVIQRGLNRMYYGDAASKIISAFRQGVNIGSDTYQFVCLYLVEIYFGGNVDLFKHVRTMFINDYRKARTHLQDYINATHTGRSISIKLLMAHYVMMEKIRHNKLYKVFFKHNTFREYVEEAVEYFEKTNVSLNSAIIKAAELKL